MPSNGAMESLKADDAPADTSRSGERTIQRNGADRERALNTRLKLTSDPVIARPLVREPRLSCCTPPIPQVGQEAPLGVQHAHLAEALHMVLGGDMMQLQALDLAAQARDRLALLADELLHDRDRLKILLQGTVERDLAQSLVDLRPGHRQPGMVGRDEVDH